MSLFEEIARRASARSREVQSQVRAGYFQLLERVRQGEEVEPDAVLAALDAVGKSCEAFEADFRRYRELKSAQTRLAARGEVEAEAAAAVAAWNAAVERRRVLMAELEAEVDRCAVEQRRSAGALYQLDRLAERCYALQNLGVLDEQLALRRESAQGEEVAALDARRTALREEAGSLEHLELAFFPPEVRS